MTRCCEVLLAVQGVRLHGTTRLYWKIGCPGFAEQPVKQKRHEHITTSLIGSTKWLEESGLGPGTSPGATMEDGRSCYCNGPWMETDRLDDPSLVGAIVFASFAKQHRFLQLMGGSFSDVSKPTFPTKFSLCSIFPAL